MRSYSNGYLIGFRGKSKRSLWMVVGIVALGLAGGVGLCGYYKGTAFTKVIRVKRTVIKRGSGEDAQDKYLVFTYKSGVFENTDSAFHGKWRSSDLQSKLERGKCYRIKGYGVRIGCTSNYPNIVSAKEVPCPR